MTQIILPVTSGTALFAAILILALTLQVIRLRRRDGIVLGDNGDRALTKAIRGQANAVEQFPIALIVMALAELQGAGFATLLPVALALVIGRACHGAYFALHGTHWRFRVVGMWLTLAAQVSLIVILGLTILL